MADGGMLKKGGELIPLKILKVFARRLPSGAISYISRISLWVESYRALEVDEALQTLKERNPKASLSALICDAIIQAAETPHPNRCRRRHWPGPKRKSPYNQK